MGLDTVEIVLATEEVFCVDLPDDECGLIVTVGDLYRLVLNKLGLLPYSVIDPTVLNTATFSPGRNRLKDQCPGITVWTAPEVWETLRAIIKNQLQVDIEEITEAATFIDDLRCD